MTIAIRNSPPARFKRVICASALFGLVQLLSSGCRQEAQRSAAACQDGGAPVDTQLLAYLSRARNAHHLADAQVDTEQLDAAVRTLRALLAGPTPSASAPAPEIVEVQADTLARLAELESQLGHFDLARADVAAGLKLVPDTNYYRGHLFEMSGLTEERRAKQLSQDGKLAESREAQQRAIAAFETAMQLQAEVIEKALGSAPAKPHPSDAASSDALTSPRQ